MTIIAPQWEKLNTAVQSCFGSWRKQGVVLHHSEDWENDKILTIFPSTVLDCGNKRRFYYSLNSFDNHDYNLALAEQDRRGKITKHPLLRDTDGYFSLAGLPREFKPLQANVLRLSRSDWRMFFWAHKHTQGRQVRFMAASSSNGLNWQMLPDKQSIALCHQGDVLCQQGKWPLHLQCNDATTVYRRPDGSWELFSAALMYYPIGQEHPKDKDLRENLIRMIQRWTSPDGWHWSTPEVTILPDEQDPGDLQFYYLTSTDLDGYRLGLLGRYNCQVRQLTIEPVWSIDGRSWQRPYRENCLPLLEDSQKVFMAVPAQYLLRSGDTLTLYYAIANYDHSHQTADGSAPQDSIAAAEIDIHRLFGLRLQDGQVRSPAVRWCKDRLQLYLSADAEMQLRWCDAFGSALESIAPISLSGREDTALDIPVPATLQGQVCRLALSGSGILFDLQV